MRYAPPVVPTILLVLAAGLGAFAYWGLLTDAGRQSFDEMDGMYPFYAGFLAIGALLPFLAWAALKIFQRLAKHT